MCEYLAEEIVVQILSRLPAKSLLKFSCVCKLWNSIIKNPNFISTYSSHKHNHYIFLLLSYSNYNYQYSLRLDNENLDEYLSLRPLFNEDDVFKVVDSSNGLVCLLCAYPNKTNAQVDVYKFVLWNPSIRKSLLIPQPSSCYPGITRFTGFGFDSRTDDYKLLLTRFWVDSVDVYLYSLNSNSWKKITDNAIACKNIINVYWFSSSVFVHGRFHWLVISEYRKVVLVFDIRDEMFGEILLPECLQDVVDMRELNVKAFGESSIAVIHARKCSNESHIWVMKEYNSGEWTKLATVGNLPEVVEFRDNDELLVQFYEEPHLASYNIKNGRVENMMALSSKYDRIFGYRHVESLVLLDIGNDISTSYA